jgi:hypothetical protein
MELNALPISGYCSLKRFCGVRGSVSYANVWSAALLQAKSEGDRAVCANVCGLDRSVRLLAMMECAALSSY